MEGKQICGVDIQLGCGTVHVEIDGEGVTDQWEAFEFALDEIEHQLGQAKLDWVYMEDV